MLFLAKAIDNQRRVIMVRNVWKQRPTARDEEDRILSVESSTLSRERATHPSLVRANGSRVTRKQGQWGALDQLLRNH